MAVVDVMYMYNSQRSQDCIEDGVPYEGVTMKSSFTMFLEYSILHFTLDPPLLTPCQMQTISSTVDGKRHYSKTLCRSAIGSPEPHHIFARRNATRRDW